MSRIEPIQREMETEVGCRGEQLEEHRSTSSETLLSGESAGQPSSYHQTTDNPTEEESTESNPPLNQAQLFRAIEVVERDSLAISESFISLFSSLRLTLSEVTRNSVDHIHCFGDAAGRLQESVLDSASKGQRYINSCLRLNEEMKGVENLAGQLKVLRRNVDALDLAVNGLLRIP